MSEVTQIILLGPQRHEPTVRRAIDDLIGNDQRPIAAITAGWEEREPEDVELAEHLGRSVHNLEIFSRVETVLREDPELLEARRDRDDQLAQLREIYRMRLRHAMPVARDLIAREGDPRLLDPEREAAIEVARSIDDHHRARVDAIHVEFAGRTNLLERPGIAKQRQELAAAIDGAPALCIAGGHVGVLLERTRLLGLGPLIRKTPIVAWSAGAMVLTERVVLFHDQPTAGHNHSEILERGFGAVRGLVALPHPRHRLDLDDPHRVAAFARRFAPSACVAFNRTARVDVAADGSWQPQPGTRVLLADGSLTPAEVA